MTSSRSLQSAAWFDVLNKGFGARSHRIDDCLAATLFRIGPLEVAYANFPFGIRTAEALAAVMQPEIRSTLRAIGADLLRFSVPASLAAGLGGNALRLPETCIQHLADWSEINLDSDVRYEIRRSRRAGVVLRPAGIADAQFMFVLYRDTVKRHGGRLRYTPSYFAALCQLAASGPEISGLIAETAERLACGFVVTAQSGEEAYYLHAGFDPQHANARPGYALLCAAISQARDSGHRNFNLMASPVDQPALLRFKEKWGGRTQALCNFDIPISNVGHVTRFALQASRRLFSAGRH